MKKAITLATFLFFLAFTKPVLAVDIPDFPACANPTGELKVEYSEGLHAVPGDTNLKSGTDKVYWTGEGNALQCLCTENGEGTQTSWWKASSLTIDQLDKLTKSGWHFIPDGSAWGLNAGAYLAKNEAYSCQGGGDNNEENNSTSDNNDTSSGTVLATSASTGTGGAVLGLASTGGNAVLLGLLSLGVALIILGTKIRKHTQK